MLWLAGFFFHFWFFEFIFPNKFELHFFSYISILNCTSAAWIPQNPSSNALISKPDNKNIFTLKILRFLEHEFPRMGCADLNDAAIFNKLLFLSITQDLSNLALETDVSPTRGNDRQRSMGERKSIGPEHLRPLPDSLTFDIRNIQAMTEIKTHIGYARAWVRLALEKKLLSRHLKTLLADNTLLRYWKKK